MFLSNMSKSQRLTSTFFPIKKCKSASCTEEDHVFLFSYEKDEHLKEAINPSDEIDWVSKFDDSLSFGAKQKSLGQIFFELRFF